MTTDPAVAPAPEQAKADFMPLDGWDYVELWVYTSIARNVDGAGQNTGRMYMSYLGPLPVGATTQPADEDEDDDE